MEIFDHTIQRRYEQSLFVGPDACAILVKRARTSRLFHLHVAAKEGVQIFTKNRLLKGLRYETKQEIMSAIGRMKNDDYCQQDAESVFDLMGSVEPYQGGDPKIQMLDVFKSYFIQSDRFRAFIHSWLQDLGSDGTGAQLKIVSSPETIIRRHETLLGQMKAIATSEGNIDSKDRKDAATSLQEMTALETSPYESLPESLALIGRHRIGEILQKYPQITGDRI